MDKGGHHLGQTSFFFIYRALSYTGVVFTWASLVPAAHHGSHAESHALVLVHHVGEQLGGRRHRDALLVAKLVDAALAGQQALPEAAVGSSTGHGAQKVGVDLNHLLNRLRGDVGARCGPRVHRNNDAMLELREAAPGGKHINGSTQLQKGDTHTDGSAIGFIPHELPSIPI